MSQVVLVVDDDPVQRRLIENMVQRFGYQAITAEGGDAAASLICGPEGARIGCMILDLVMPDLDGMGVLARMKDAGRSIPVIVQTAHGGIDNVVSAMRAGAVDFVVKPASPERLQVSLRNAIAANTLAGELQRIKRSRDGTLTFSDVITRSAQMKTVLRAAEKAASSSIPALVAGESGVGKELIARAIHGSGARRAKPFVAVNCGALPENLVESILFGHEKGAFTGATEKHAGKFVEADGGTLFLDEIGELPLTAQVKLLRALQENEIEPVGGKKPVKVDVRIVSATNRDLIADVKAGRFREDLFYRLHVFPITVPALRTRREDIPELARYFLARFAAEEGKRVTAIEADAVALLTGHAWPGNVRQLENAIFRAVVLADGETLGVNEFPQLARSHKDEDGALPEMAGAPILAPQALELTTSTNSLSLLDGQDHVRTLDELERDVIRFAISHYRGQMSEVARRLQIGRSTLYRKLESLGLEAEAKEPAPVN
jgi:DNA-binding NtrC family response regulator